MKHFTQQTARKNECGLICQNINYREKMQTSNARGSGLETGQIKSNVSWFLHLLLVDFTLFNLNSSYLTIKNDFIGLSCESKGHLFWTSEASHGFSFIRDSKSGVTVVSHSQTSDYWQNLDQFAVYSGQELPNRWGRDHVTHLRNSQQFIFTWHVWMDSYQIKCNEIK